MSNQIDLNLIEFKENIVLKNEKGKHLIFDPIRKKYLVFQPEEFIRQLLILHLINKKEYPKTFLSVEKTVIVNTRKKRFDILVYNQQHQPWLMVECKAANIDITQAAFAQIATYNMTLNVPYLLVTNGITSYCCKIDKKEGTYEFLSALPDFPNDQISSTKASP